MKNIKTACLPEKCEWIRGVYIVGKDINKIIKVRLVPYQRKQDYVDTTE